MARTGSFNRKPARSSAGLQVARGAMIQHGVLIEGQRGTRRFHSPLRVAGVTADNVVVLRETSGYCGGLSALSTRYFAFAVAPSQLPSPMPSRQRAAMVVVELGGRGNE
jgi:hypothetical protein